MANESKLYRIYSFCLTLGICHLFLGALLLSVFLFSTNLSGGLTPAGWRSEPRHGYYASASTVTVTAQVSPIIIVEPACNDTIDNDSDGLIDYPNDPGCSSSSDTDEYNAPSGGGGGGPPPTIITNVVIIGRAYPESIITILKDGQVFTTAFADKDANFKVQITNITAGVHTFGAWSEDKQKRKSLTYSFTANVIEKMTTTISGVFLPPTIAIDRTQLNRGEMLNVLGQTAPQSEISIHFNSNAEIIEKVKSESDGTWLLAYNTSPLEDGQHNTKAKSVTFDNLQSIFSQSLAFIVGKGVLPGETCPKADLNKEGKVNLIDFSILMFWWSKANACADQNRDGVVNLPDFSIMMYWWTG